MREIIFDTETTGLSAKEGHRIIEIGAVEMVNRYRTGETYHVYINPKREIDPGAMKIHGISNEFLVDKPTFGEVVDEFLEFIKGAHLVAHNAQFDMGFLNHHLQCLRMKEIPNDIVIDTLALARRKYPGQKNNLDALCSRLGVDSSNRVKHGALLDAELLADVYAEMMGVGANQRNLMFASKEDEGGDSNSKTQSPTLHFGKGTKTYEPRDFKLTEEEEAGHAAFLDNMKESLWSA